MPRLRWLLHDETPHEHGCPRQRHQSYCAAVRHTGADCDCDGNGEYAAGRVAEPEPVKNQLFQINDAFGLKD